MAEFIASIINWLVESVGDLLGVVLMIFPDSPWSEPALPPDGVVLSYIAWLIPFPAMFQSLTLFVSAVLLYYVVMVAARWLKLLRA